MNANRKTGMKLGVVVIAMLGFSYALVPLYDVICDITGLNGRTGVAAAGRAAALPTDMEREVTVEFLSHVNQSGAWRFAPEVRRMRVTPGKQYTMNYIATNLRDASAAAQAVPSVAPTAAATYFNKIECFCFARQAFDQGERRLLPVTFVVNPQLPERIKLISLAYTIFDALERSAKTASNTVRGNYNV